MKVYQVYDKAGQKYFSGPLTEKELKNLTERGFTYKEVDPITRDILTSDSASIKELIKDSNHIFI